MIFVGAGSLLIANPINSLTNCVGWAPAHLNVNLVKNCVSCNVHNGGLFSHLTKR
jgi:hypothetical protein